MWASVSPIVVMMVVWVVVMMIGIPVTAIVTYTPPHGIPSSVVIRPVPGIVIPWVPEPGVINIGDTVPIPWVIEMAAMESSQSQSIVIVDCPCIGEPLGIAFVIPQVIETLCGQFVGLLCPCVCRNRIYGRRWSAATPVVFVDIARCRSWCHCSNTG